MSSNLISGTKIKNKKKDNKWWRVKLDSETLNAVWSASKSSVQKNKKKYSRKTKHKKYE